VEAEGGPEDGWKSALCQAVLGLFEQPGLCGTSFVPMAETVLMLKLVAIKDA
jgi:hypothetical protein